jgi:site-specific DNA recombinase
VFDALSAAGGNTSERKRLVEQAAQLAATWTALLPDRLRRLLCELITRIEVTEGGVSIHLQPSRLAASILDDASDATARGSETGADTMILTIGVRLNRIGQGTRLILSAPSAGIPAANPGMIRLLAQAHLVQQRLLKSTQTSIIEFASQEQMTGSYIARLIRLARLAPDITQAILVYRL